jgi:REP element-mobilizing transposase RayT
MVTPLMAYDPYRHNRRSIRLRGYDYSKPGAYFVTICTHDRESSLETASVAGLVTAAWADLPWRCPGVALDEFIVMPNHVHGIIVLTGAASSAPTLGEVVRAFKSLSAIEANRARGAEGQPFWQRNYYEHIVRDDDELRIIRQYIRSNPSMWETDLDNPARRATP